MELCAPFTSAPLLASLLLARLPPRPLSVCLHWGVWWCWCVREHALPGAGTSARVCARAWRAGKSRVSLLRTNNSGSFLFAAPHGLDSSSSTSSTEVYIIAEAFCSNCKEHSYLFDEKIMANEDIRNQLNVSLRTIAAVCSSPV